MTLDPAKEIFLKSGEKMLVSDVDFDRVSLLGWTRKKSGSHIYARAFADGSEVLAHRFILSLDASTETVVDHVNGNGLDNRRSNLRLCTRLQNNWNKRVIRSSTGFFGVHKNAWGFTGKIVHEGKTLYAGTFASAIEAADAVDALLDSVRPTYGVRNQVDKKELSKHLRARELLLQEELQQLRERLREYDHH